MSSFGYKYTFINKNYSSRKKGVFHAGKTDKYIVRVLDKGRIRTISQHKYEAVAHRHYLKATGETTKTIQLR